MSNQDKKFLYICQLSDIEQEFIRNDITQALSNISWATGEDIENAMSSKLIDLEDTIDISKYL